MLIAEKSKLVFRIRKVDNMAKWTIIILSIQVTIMGLTISHLCYKLGYEQGKASVYQSFAEDGTEGTHYVTDDKPVKRYSR
jgi:hypothetical protein